MLEAAIYIWLLFLFRLRDFTPYYPAQSRNQSSDEEDDKPECALFEVKVVSNSKHRSCELDPWWKTFLLSRSSDTRYMTLWPLP